MWNKLLEFGQQLLKLKGQVKDNTSDLTKLKKEFKRLGSGTHKLLLKIKSMEQKHAHEIQLIKEVHTAQIKQLELQIIHLKENYIHNLEKSNMFSENQALKVINEMQGRMLLAEGNSRESRNNSEKRITNDESKG